MRSFTYQRKRLHWTKHVNIKMEPASYTATCRKILEVPGEEGNLPKIRMKCHAASNGSLLGYLQEIFDPTVTPAMNSPQAMNNATKLVPQKISSVTC